MRFDNTDISETNLAISSWLHWAWTCEQLALLMQLIAMPLTAN